MVVITGASVAGLLVTDRRGASVTNRPFTSLSLSAVIRAPVWTEAESGAANLNCRATSSSMIGWDGGGGGVYLFDGHRICIGCFDRS